MSELVAPGKREFQRNAEGLHRHDRHGSNGRADGQVDEGVLLSVDWGDFVDHDGSEYRHDEAV